MTVFKTLFRVPKSFDHRYYEGRSGEVKTETRVCYPTHKAYVEATDVDDAIYRVKKQYPKSSILAIEHVPDSEIIR